MAIYHYFAGREALLNAVVDSEFEQLVDFFDRSNGTQNFEAAMIHSMDGYIDPAHAASQEIFPLAARPR
jgi:AcrR family transcriptional regulator